MIYAIALQTEYDDQLTRLRTKSKLGPLLPAITAETGGGYFELTHTADLAAIVRRVAEERHHQYLIGFSSPGARRRDTPDYGGNVSRNGGSPACRRTR